jgi:hypothetical protein
MDNYVTKDVTVEGLAPVYATQDEDGHWFVLPLELKYEFWKDLENEDMVDSGDFADKWSKYMTGGALNLVQLYAKI